MRKRYQFLATGLLALGLCASNAMAADTSDFTGFKLGVTAGWQDAKVNYSGYLAGRSQSDSGAVPGLNAAYGFALGSSGVMTIGASYDLNSIDFGTMRYTYGVTQSLKTKMKNHASLYVAPGVRLNSDWLAYAKFAYHRAKSKFEDTVAGAGSKTHNGFGYGVGVAYALSKNVELSAEVNYVKLSKESFGASHGEPKLTSVTFGANYRFD